MKIFFSENTVDYGTYTFNYAIYCLKQNNTELSEIYEKGFLPYSGNLELTEEVFYLARSLRVDLEKFDDTSENRRVNRLMEDLHVALEVIKKEDFDINSEAFIEFSSRYIAERIGEDNMSTERLNFILKQDTFTHIFVFKNTQQTLGYVLTCMEGNMLHYWFAFFETTYMRSHSLGKWMMWRVIRWAKDNGLANVYLGTAYKPSALYKIRDHKGLEFFDGKGWSQDVAKLKKLCESDLEPKQVDAFKSLDNPNDFLQNI